jgi:diketogulonate reductase-like aldo/keto reductase
MNIVPFVCTRVFPTLVVLLSIFVAWLLRGEVPEGRFFATVIPLTKGVLPPNIVGHGRLTSTSTPPVPDDMSPLPRPAGEEFLVLPQTEDRMPQNGLGMCCRPTAYDDVCVERTVLWYLLLGGRHIDTAHLYLNHEAIGRGMREAVRRGVPRQEIFLTTKVFPSHFGYDAVRTVLPRYLQQLQVEYIDLVLLHWPNRFGLPISGCRGLTSVECRRGTWKALSEWQHSGVVRNVGVSNFAVSTLQEMTSYGSDGEDNYMAPVANNQIQWNPWAPQGKT